MLMLNITVPLFVTRASFTDDPNVLDIYQILMGLASLCSLGSVLVAVMWNDWINNLCPARSDIHFFHSIGIGGDSLLFMYLSIILACAGFTLAAAYCIESAVNGYVALGIGTAIIATTAYRWTITLKRTVERMTKKYGALNHADVKNDWTGMVTEFFTGVELSSHSKKVHIGL